MIDAIRVKDPFSDHNIVTYDVIHVMKFQKCQNSRFIRKSGVSENRAFIRKSKGLGKSGFYAWIFLTINVNNIHCISKKDYILVINTLTQICIISLTVHQL